MPSKPNKRVKMCMKKTLQSKYRPSLFPKGKYCRFIDIVAYGIKPRSGVYDGTRKMTGLERLDLHHLYHPYRKLNMNLPVEEKEEEEIP